MPAPAAIAVFTDPGAPQPREGGGPGGGPALRGIGAPYIMVASVVLGLAIGLSLDAWLTTLPWCTIACSILFIVVGMYHMVKEGTR